MKEVWKVAAAFIGVFIAGAVFGGLFSLGVGRRMANRAPTPPQLQPQMLRLYSARLDLTEEQKQVLTPMIDRYDDVLTKLRTEQFESSRSVLQKLHTEFAAHLTSAQKDKLAIIEDDQLKQQQRDIMGRGRGGGGPSGGGRGMPPGGGGRGPGGGRGGGPRAQPDPAVPATPAAAPDAASDKP